MKLDLTILCKKKQKVPVFFVKSITKKNKQQYVGFYYKPILKNF